jgi:hypothetical protein
MVTRQSDEMAKPARNCGAVLRRLDHRGDRVVACRSLASGEIHRAVARERLAIECGTAAIGGRRMTCDQVIDRKSIFDRAQTIFDGALLCAHRLTTLCPVQPMPWWQCGSCRRKQDRSDGKDNGNSRSHVAADVLYVTP